MRSSVIIANYNYGHFLPAAIDSLLAQTVPVDEIIVVDDGSQDNSRQVLELYGDKIIAVFQQNTGQAAAISRGFARATGEVVCLLDADDVFFPRKIEKILRLYRDNPEAGWVFHALEHFKPETAPAMAARPDETPLTVKPVDERAAMRAGQFGYEAPATSGLTFRRSFIAPLFPLPAAESIYVSDHYIKFYALAQGPGLHVLDALGGQLVHGANLYTGANQTATRARIFVNTAFFLARIAPQTILFCDRIMESGIASALRSGQLGVLKPRILAYLKQRPWKVRVLIGSKTAVKAVLGK